MLFRSACLRANRSAIRRGHRVLDRSDIARHAHKRRQNAGIAGRLTQCAAARHRFDGQFRRAAAEAETQIEPAALPGVVPVRGLAAVGLAGEMPGALAHSPLGLLFFSPAWPFLWPQKERRRQYLGWFAWSIPSDV